MRKSPLSTPGGSRSKQNHKFKFYGKTRISNCGFDAYGCYSYNGEKPNRGDDDYIPLNCSTTEQRRHSGNRYGSGGGRNHYNSGSPFFNHNRGNHFANTQPRFNDSYSPHEQSMQSGMQFYGQNKSMRKDDHRQVDISKYVNMESFLEDPWAELMQKLDELKNVNTNGCSSIPYFSENDKEGMIFVDDCFRNIQQEPESINLYLKIDDNTKKSEVKDSLCTESQGLKFDSILSNKSTCNVSNDNNQAPNKDNVKDI